MTYERPTAVVLIALVWGRAVALSMLVSLARRPHTTATRAALWTVALQHSRTRFPQGADLTPRHQPPVLRRGGWRGGGVSLVMSTTSRDVPVLSNSRQQRESSSEGGGVAEPAKVGDSGASAPAGTGPTLARVKPAEEPWLTEAADRLRAGKLVAFPTETVYGLGANALSEEAVLTIFQAKQRPLTDPLIVHVPDTASALAVVDFEAQGGGGEKARRLLDLLGEKLWPGPLTMILKAAESVPACVTAGTGFVGVRCPAHPVTRQLLSLAGVPVAAPSANRFGHVSPTQAAHVMEDLGSSDILVLDGDASGACGVGIESTVAKIDVENDRILILRMGGATQERIRQALTEGGEEFSEISVHAGSVAGGKTEAKEKTQQDEGAPALSPNGPSEAEEQAPGQLLRHYSPDLEVFRVLGATSGSTSGRVVGGRELLDLVAMARTSVVIDFSGQLKGLEASALAYSDLSVEGNTDEAAEGLFRALRWAETQPTAQRLLIAGLPSTSSGDLAAAVNDRIYRSASGKTISAE